jgi:hypothetical protein
VKTGYDGTMGGGHAVLRNSSAGVNYGASSPRKDGAAVPEQDPYFDAAPPAKPAAPSKPAPPPAQKKN